ncbi:hypothetical protein MTR67_051551 [Solanum verrucosum]|uniref:Integrase zinc-binding domain-containing protein n=1 Tax=Solanum verrucosum TaxID=315347 RepID=A0AAF0V7N7_SOLVR|nr:hypothetical protein MTR67_051551 [Solanum verrucosum]
MGSLAHLQVSRHPLAREVQTLANEFMRLEVIVKGRFLACVEAISSFLDKIKGKQFDDEKLSRIRDMAHSSRYSIYPGANKMYHAMRKHYWWSRIKHDIVDFVSQCPNCQQVKYEHHRSGKTLQRMPIPEWKWEWIAMNFVVGLPKSLGRFDSIWVIVDRLTKSTHFIPVKGVMRFGKRDKLILRCNGSFEALKRVGEVEYELALPRGPLGVHPLFHVSMLKKYMVMRIIVFIGVQILLDENLSYYEETVPILDREAHKLRSKEISSMKVQWKNRPVEESTSDAKDDIHGRYRYLFADSGTLSYPRLLLIVRG